MSLPYYKAYPRDFIEGTVGMDFETKGAYRLVLDLIYMQDGDLPDDPRYISGVLGCTTRKWNSMRAKLIAMGKIQVNGEFLTNYRAVSELETLRKLRDKNAENGSKSRKNNNVSKSNDQLTRVNTEPEPDIEDNSNELSLVPSVPDENRSRKKYPDDFEAFWKAYPKRPTDTKALAFKAFKKASPLAWRAGKDLQRCAELYADFVNRTGHEPMLVQTWVNREGWTADYELPSARASPESQPTDEDKLRVLKMRIESKLSGRMSLHEPTPQDWAKAIKHGFATKKQAVIFWPQHFGEN